MSVYSHRVIRSLVFIALLASSSSASAKFELSIEGAPEELTDNIRLHLANLESQISGKQDAVERTIKSRVRAGLEALGYYHAKIETFITANKVQLNINLGAPVVWVEPDIVISNIPASLPESLKNLIENPAFVPGQVINHQTYDQYKNHLLTSFMSLGYLDAHWKRSRLQVNVERNEALALLHMELGERYIFNDIAVRGSGLSDKTIIQLVNVQKGEWHNSDKITEIYDNLLSSGYFQYVEIDIEKHQPNIADLTVDLTDKARHQFSTGLGYGTDTGARGKLGWSRSQLNARGDNLFTNLQISQIGEELTAQYVVPWPHPLKRYLAWDTGWKHEETDDRESELLTTGISFNRAEKQHWQYKVGINLEHEAYQQGENPEEVITYLLPNVNYLRRSVLGNSGDRGILKYWLDSAFGFSVLDDQSRFLSVEVGAVYTLEFNNKHGFSTRFDLGGIMTDEFYTVPLSKRFYTGGDHTVRGFSYNSLSSRDENDELQGGQFLNVFSIEYRYRILDEWKLAAFIDTGRAFISSHEPFSTGAGVGARWEMPIGMIAFDVAVPVRNERAKATRLHIYMSTLL